MPIKFTKHVLQRMKSRNISKKDIIDAINPPESVKKDSYGNLIAQKMRGKYLLRIFYFLDGKTKVIITVYKTSKLDKYL